MKKLITALTVAATLVGATAQPINYQGKLSDKSGNPVNGTKNFSLRIFDAKTGGKSIYEEAMGNVAVKDGLYSFNFGESGKSVVTPTETIGFADGEKQIFNYTVKNTPVLGEIKISGGEYSWTEAGSSDAGNFTATANKNSGAVSAIFLTGAPEAGQDISIAYDHNSDGVMGALSRGGQAWLEITVGGETLSPRERLVAVPFALRAQKANEVSINGVPDFLVFSSVSLPSVGNSTGRRSRDNEWVTIRKTPVFVSPSIKQLRLKSSTVFSIQKGWGDKKFDVKYRYKLGPVSSNVLTLSVQGNRQSQNHHWDEAVLDVVASGWQDIEYQMAVDFHGTPTDVHNWYAGNMSNILIYTKND